MLQALWSSEITLPPVVDSVLATRNFIEDQLIAHDLPYLLHDMRLVGSELATNATRHARTPFRVLIQGHNEQVRLTVSDGSPLLPVQRDPARDEPGGRGLLVVAAYAHDWGIGPDGTDAKSVWATFAVRS